MNVDDYIKNHWEKNQVWTHLLWEKHQTRFRTIASMLAGKSFVDVGCVFGHSTYYLRRFKPGDWSGIDFSEHAIKKAAALFPDIKFFYSAGFDLASAVPGSFDGVVCSEVLEHVDDDRALVKGLRDIASKVVVVTTPMRKVSDPGHLRIYAYDSLLVLFREFKRIEIHKIDPFFYVRAEV